EVRVVDCGRDLAFDFEVARGSLQPARSSAADEMDGLRKGVHSVRCPGVSELYWRGETLTVVIIEGKGARLCARSKGFDGCSSVPKTSTTHTRCTATRRRCCISCSS